MSPKKNGYVSYLLRLWPIQGHDPTVWRASLENVATGERHGFADLETLLGYLFQQLEKANNVEGASKKGGANKSETLK